MSYNVEIRVMECDDGYYVVAKIDGRHHDQVGPFATIEAAKTAADDLARMLASVNN